MKKFQMFKIYGKNELFVYEKQEDVVQSLALDLCFFALEETIDDIHYETSEGITSMKEEVLKYLEEGEDFHKVFKEVAKEFLYDKIIHYRNR